MPACSARRRRRAPLLGGRKPRNRNEFEARPDATRAVRIALGPGIGTTLRGLPQSQGFTIPMQHWSWSNNNDDVEQT